jgi:hypothetical protein
MRHLVALIGSLVPKAGERGHLFASDLGISAVPLKAIAARRHRILKQQYRVTNWAEYGTNLR